MRGENLRKGSWYEEEDERLKLCVTILGARRWDSIAKISGLGRSGKSCRLRWLNYLRPYLKHGPITPHEEQLILELHQKWGNKWAKIARRLPGRTDNEVKNYWRTHLRKKLDMQQNSLLLQCSPSSSSNSVESLVNTSSSSEQTTNSPNQLETSLQDGDTITTNTEINCTSNISVSTDEYNGPISSQFYNCNFDDNKEILSDCMIANSPYENRISDWINMVSTEQSNDLSPGCWGNNGSSTEFCLDYPMTWSCLGDGNAWDFLDTKWDMDLFNVNGCFK